MLVRLMYASRAAPAVDQEELVAILKKSKASNPKAGVTGVLCFSEGTFIQVLEGARLDPYAQGVGGLVRRVGGHRGRHGPGMTAAHFALSTNSSNE